jgi:signal transduction histidine kinase
VPSVRRGSIASKLTGLTTLVSAAALLLACAAFGLYDRTTNRATTVRNLSVQAQIVGSNSVSALLFNDPPTAGVTLSALRAVPSIVAADIYTLDGERFAHYQRDGTSGTYSPDPIPSNDSDTVRFDAQQIALVRRIMFHEKPVGAVAIRSDFSELNARRGQYIGLAAVVLMVSLVAALLMSWFSQRSISRPIVRLADLTRTIAHDEDYSVRAPATTGADEIAVLTEGFNGMLLQIQQRDTSLQAARQELEARVRQRTAELEAVNAELEAFSYSVSHDLRAPLRHVTGFASLLEARAKDRLDAQCSRYVQTISQAANRMGQLIDDLLAFSRIGRGQLVRRTVRLNDLVREARDEVTFGLTNRDIEWQIADLPAVEGDPAMLRLVMINLLSNAVKYTSPRPHARIEIGADAATNGEVIVFVRDNGVGFDMQYVGKLFGVFQRLHGTDEFEGTGIGLANVRRIVNRHGGRVWAEGAVDQGATFYVALPTEGHHV